MTNEFIFVYGTLRKELVASMHYVIARYCEFFADGLMHGKLYEVNGYPGAIESSNSHDVVQGELYRIKSSEKVLSLLDDYEECTEKYLHTHEYIRKKLLISVVGDESISAWVYICNRDITGLTRIENGDYPGYLIDKAVR